MPSTAEVKLLHRNIENSQLPPSPLLLLTTANTTLPITQTVHAVCIICKFHWLCHYLLFLLVSIVSYQPLGPSTFGHFMALALGAGALGFILDCTKLKTKNAVVSLGYMIFDFSWP